MSSLFKLDIFAELIYQKNNIMSINANISKGTAFLLQGLTNNFGAYHASFVSGN